MHYFVLHTTTYKTLRRKQMAAAKVREKYEHEVTIEQVVAVADEIWGKFKKRFPLKESHPPDRLTAFYEDMQKDYREFGQTYPIILRYMCEFGQYSTRAITRYLKYIQRHPWGGIDSYLESQATYVKILYRTLNPKSSPASANNCYNTVLAMLKAEHKQFEEMHKNAEKSVKEAFDDRVVRNKIELREYFKKYGNEAVDVQLSVVSKELTPDSDAANITTSNDAAANDAASNNTASNATKYEQLKMEADAYAEHELCEIGGF